MTSISDSSDLMTAKMGVPSLSKETKVQSKVKLTPITLTSLMFTPIFPSKPEDPYQEGKDDYLEDMKEKEGLKSFQDGYRRGYRRGYKEAIKKVKKQ